MADILIRSMEMPDGCHHCRFSYLDEVETNGGEPCSVIMCSAMEQGTNGAEYDGNRPFWCPLVPLPEGHGRLGDLETAEAILHNKAFDLAGTSAEYNALNWALRQIKALPTIVPAEGGTENDP